MPEFDFEAEARAVTGSIDAIIAKLQSTDARARTEGEADGYRRGVEAAIGMGEAWPLPDLLERLAGAVEHLMHDHNCDAHGWEERDGASTRAREHAKRLRALLPPEPAKAERCDDVRLAEREELLKLASVEMDHYCHALGCKRACPPRMLMCRQCWALVPPGLQADVYRTVKLRGPGAADASWAPWWRAQAMAIAYVAMIVEPNEAKRDAYLNHALWFADILEARPTFSPSPSGTSGPSGKKP